MAAPSVFLLQNVLLGGVKMISLHPVGPQSYMLGEKLIMKTGFNYLPVQDIVQLLLKVIREDLS